MSLGFLAAVVLLVGLPALLGLAAAGDILRYRIPNWICLSVAALSMPTSLASGLPLTEVLLQVAAGAAVLGAMVPLFLAGGIGGGDVKLLAALACWTGFSLIPAFAVCTVLLGGAVALAIYALKRIRPVQDVAGEPATRSRRDRQVPYGAAIVVGAIVMIAQFPATQALLAR